MPKEGLLALGAHKVLDVPLFAEGGHHTLLDRATTRSADWYAHLVVAAKAVQLTFDLASARGELNATLFAIEVIRVVGFALQEGRG